MKRAIVAGLLLLAACPGCINRNTPEGVIAEHIGKRIVVEKTDSVRNFMTGEAITYSELTARYDYLSLVYVDHDCSACRVALAEWTDGLETVDRLTSDGKYAVLFVYRGDDAGKYLKSYFGDASHFPYYRQVPEKPALRHRPVRTPRRSSSAWRSPRASAPRRVFRG